MAASPSSGVNSFTGEGLAKALAGAQVVVDVANSPSFEDAAVLTFFETIQQGLNAGFLDETHVDIAAVLLGSGVRLFDRLAGTPVVLGNPTVIPVVGVTHLRYPVCKAYSDPTPFLAPR